MQDRIEIEVGIAHVRVNVSIAHVIKKVLGNVPWRPEYFVANPGLIGLAEMVEARSVEIGTARQAIGRNYTAIADRIRTAKRYLDDVGKGLALSGKATGFVLNCILAISSAGKLTNEQAGIWGGKLGVEPLISAEAMVEFFAALAGTYFKFPDAIGNITKTGAEIIRTQAANIGSPDSNALSALLAAAEDNTLTTGVLTETVRVLRRENADANAIPVAIRTATTKRYGNGASADARA